MNTKRPINLELSSLSFPPMAIASILHRISGVLLFLLLPWVLCLFSESLHSETSFALMKYQLTQPFYQLLVWAFSSALAYHVLAGIRHMLMDVGLGESLRAGAFSAKLVIVLGILSTFFLGIWLW